MRATEQTGLQPKLQPHKRTQASVPRKLAMFGGSGSFAITDFVPKTASCQTDSATGKAQPARQTNSPEPAKGVISPPSTPPVGLEDFLSQVDAQLSID